MKSRESLSKKHRETTSCISLLGTPRLPRQNVANSLANVGVEFLLPTPLLSNGETYISFDYFFKGFGGNGGGTIMPLAINQRVYTSANELRSYYYFGIGVTFININGSGSALSGRFGVGTELGPATIAEIGVLLSDRAASARANAITFNIGYRF